MFSLSKAVDKTHSANSKILIEMVDSIIQRDVPS